MSSSRSASGAVRTSISRLCARLAAVASGGFGGLGTGWSFDEFAATAPRPMAERGDALDEFLDMAEALWGPEPVSFKNERYTVYPAEVGPKPAERIQVLLGGRGKKALDRVARRASGWLPSLLPPGQVDVTFSRLREKAAEYGRSSPVTSVSFATCQPSSTRASEMRASEAARSETPPTRF